MMISKGILHILDFNSGMCLLSQEELDFSRGEVDTYLEKHIEKAQGDSGNKAGMFYESSEFKLRFQKYLSEQMEFSEFTAFVGNSLYNTLAQSDTQDTVDLVCVDYTDNDIRYLAVLVLGNRVAYTHQAENSDGHISNQLIRHFAILPSMTQRIDAYAIVRCDDLSVKVFDKKVSIDGEDIFVLAEKVLQCTTQISPKEAIKTVNKTIAQVAKAYGANTAVVLSKAKSYLVENAEVSDSFSPVELGREVFSDSRDMQNAFEAQVAEAKLPEDIVVEKKVAMKTGKSHKIKTDTGIEVTFPAEYFENHEYIEFINNPNGTISIELKNIGKIVDK
jgi:hypothetical protein